VLLAVAGALLAGCAEKAGEVERSPPLVTVAVATTGDAPVTLDEIGVCTSPESVAIQPQASGRIVGIHFTDGADLQVGDLLFTIDPRPYQAALDQAVAGLAQNEASLELARLELARAEALLPTRAISKEDYDTKRSAVGVGEALVQASRAAIEAARVDLDYTSIHSPIVGRAGERLVDLGNVLTANSGVTLLTIQRLDPIYADFTIPERDLATVRRRMAEEALTTLVRLPGEPEAAAAGGPLTFLDNAVRSSTGTVRLRATLANPEHRFWPGQFVQVRLVLRVLKGAVLVPSVAPQISQTGPYVYVVGPGSTVALRPVQLGPRHGEQVVVTEGLKAGETVVTHGQFTVTPGGKVRVQEAPREGGEAAASPTAGGQGDAP